MNPSNPNAGYLVASQGQQFGPYSLEQIRQYVGEGRLIAADLAWTEGMTSWEPVGTLLGGLPGAELSPPPLRMGQGGPPAFGPGSTALYTSKPPNHMLPAVLTTLLCCLPFGIVAIVYASQVDSKYLAGDHAGALAASNNARMWYLIALGAGLAIGLLAGVGNVIQH